MTSDAWTTVVVVAHDGERLRVRLTASASGVTTASAPDGWVSQAGSISKQLVAVVVLQLVHEKRLGLSDTVGRHLPDAPASWSDLTVHELLTHTSGLGHWSDAPGLDIDTVASREELDTLVARAPLVAGRGDRFGYSGPGYLALAAIVERVEGRAYSEAVRDRVLEPSGMVHSSSGVARAGGAGVASGGHEGRPVPVNPVLSELPGTGDLWTTTRDLLAFDAALRDGRLLTPASVALTASRFVRVPSSGSDQDIEPLWYGYGTFLGTVAGRPARFHPGDNPGYRSLLARLVDDGLTIAVLSRDDATDLGHLVRTALERVP